MEACSEELIQELIQLTDNELSVKTDCDFRSQLAAYITNLINHHPHQLIGLLYRVDISEQRIRQLLKQHDDAGRLIADLIIERQLQKIQLRRQFIQQANDIPEDEKW